MKFGGMKHGKPSIHLEIARQVRFGHTSCLVSPEAEKTMALLEREGPKDRLIKELKDKVRERTALHCFVKQALR